MSKFKLILIALVSLIITLFIINFMNNEQIWEERALSYLSDRYKGDFVLLSSERDYNDYKFLFYTIKR